MKLTKIDMEQLLNWGHPEKDFHQIEMAMETRYTTYKLNDKRISRKKAIELLGREKYLAGISRSAFHYSAAQHVKDSDDIVYFDSFALFK